MFYSWVLYASADQCSQWQISTEVHWLSGLRSAKNKNKIRSSCLEAGTLFHQTFMTLLIPVDTSTFRKRLKNVLFDRAYKWLLLALLDESYSGALQISRWYWFCHVIMAVADNNDNFDEFRSEIYLSIYCKVKDFKDNKLKTNASKRIAEELACDVTTENYIHCFGDWSRSSTRLIPKTSLPPRSLAPPRLCPGTNPLRNSVGCSGWNFLPRPVGWHRPTYRRHFFLNCDSGAALRTLRALNGNRSLSGDDIVNCQWMSTMVVRSDRETFHTAQFSYHISCLRIGMHYLLEIGA